MTDVSQGPGWWMASDHKWYPPELHPAVRAAAVTQAASALLTDGSGQLAPTAAVFGSPMAGVDPGAGYAAAGPAPGMVYAGVGYGGAPLAPSVLGATPYGAAVGANGGSVATLAPGDVAVGKRKSKRARAKAPAGAGAARGAPAGFDTNPYAMSGRGPWGPTPTKKKGHLAGPLVALIVVALVAAAGAVGYKLTHPSPQRSPDAVALNFYQKLGASPPDYTGAVADIVPSQQGQAGSMNSMHEVQAVVQELQTQNLSVLNPSKPTATTKSVIVQGCNATLSCGPEEPAIPTEEIGGKWYVDFTSWDATALHQIQSTT